ncbi:drug resistance transporter, EmrB/QacA subfamily [Actinopolyspora xinjiangensis]|uniref:Drug resistance transporter, EmrB/QacA subfamily n=1 Tax=Actinopolyspora xinjiangensis TaxID=405564 RepID=A0A1H0WTX3_9ACTN|nr:MFS transporter [Actinopolyspora xinjiangensis]SDP94039.1 drug resistance transporter, EmrB/QacA subfamily [Actinopolyspora xinjiangensis]
MSVRSADAPVPLHSARGRRIILATMLGSGVAFLDGSVVNVALPAIGRDLGGTFALLQWVLDAYLLTLSALLLLGGALGDRYGRRRIFTAGLVLFTLASLGCGIARGGAELIAARLVQGVGGALLVPGSLALINASVRPEDRGKAVGTWAGLTGVASAVGPFVGGWLVDTASWRWVFFINLPVAALALAVTLRHVPESNDPTISGPPDTTGAAAVTLGLAGAVYALIETPAHGWNAVTVAAALVGIVGLACFPRIEAKQRAPLLPLSLFRSRQFVGANLTTFTVYGALSTALFLLSLQLQQTLGYSAMATGLATLPITVIMLLLSSRMGALAQRIGPRWPMTIGPVVCACGLVLMTRVTPGASYTTGVLPGVLVFGIGLSITVAPLTSAVLASVGSERGGVASGVNNAVSRVAGLLAVAVLPPLAGLSGTATGQPLGQGYGNAMLISAGLCVVGAALAALTIERAEHVRTVPLPAVNHACQDPCTENGR